jgi:hypothetical protein
MPPAAKTPVTWFVLFNLIALPLIGRGIWTLMLALNADELRLAGVLVSVLGTLLITLINAWLTQWATWAGLPRRGRMAMWLVTGLTFALTIGLGVFSPINLLIMLVTSAA